MLSIIYCLFCWPHQLSHYPPSVTPPITHCPHYVAPLVTCAMVTPLIAHTMYCASHHPCHGHCPGPSLPILCVTLLVACVMCYTHHPCHSRAPCHVHHVSHLLSHAPCVAPIACVPWLCTLSRMPYVAPLTCAMV